MVADGSSPEQAMPVGLVSSKIGTWVHRLGTVWVQGQVVETSQSARMVFLTLRDPHAEASMGVSCSTQVFDMAGPIPQGATVQVRAKPSWWTKSGRLSLQAEEVRVAGEGRLLAQLEQRKRMLQAEGLFDPARKKRLPFLPRVIGLITAPGSDAHTDFLRHVTLRWPAAVVEVHPAAMQGPRCAEEVMVGVHTLDVRPDVDVIVITRGGGSMEDLLPFSDEGVVRAVAAARKPVVVGVGHEADSPLVDLAADVRASTPTDAAKRVVPDAAELGATLQRELTHLRRAVVARLDREQHQLDAMRSRPVLLNPVASIDAHAERVDAMLTGLRRSVTTTLQQEKQAVEHMRARIEAMSPKNTLARGYAILIDDVGEAVTSVGQLEPGQMLEAYLADGSLELAVEDITPKNEEQR